MTTSTSSEMSDDTKSIITVIVLLLLYPLGVILMWFWVHWPRWVKLLISFPIILGVAGIIIAILLIATNPYKQVNKSSGQSKFYEDVVEVETNSKSEFEY